MYENKLNLLSDAGPDLDQDFDQDLDLLTDHGHEIFLLPAVPAPVIYQAHEYVSAQVL